MNRNVLDSWIFQNGDIYPVERHRHASFVSDKNTAWIDYHAVKIGEWDESFNIFFPRDVTRVQIKVVKGIITEFPSEFFIIQHGMYGYNEFQTEYFDFMPDNLAYDN